MANDSSLQEGAAQFAFDLDSQPGVMHLLASVRASDIGAEKKNELRDLVFLYTNGGKDQSVRITLEQKIHTYNLVPIAPPAKAVAEEVLPVQTKYPFGTSRPSPSFPVSTKTTIPATTPTPVAKPVVAPEPSPVAKPDPLPPPVEIKPEVVAAPINPPASVDTPPKVSEPAPSPAAPQPPAYDTNQSLQRIREIKSLVNDKVGNPVNLVDIDNEVGREYMGALLDAMKKLNSGTSALSAMKRLEDAYQKVEKTLTEHDRKKVDEKLSIAVPPQSIGKAVEEQAPAPTTVPVSPPIPVPEPVKKTELPISQGQPKSEPIVVKMPEPVVPRAEFELPVVPPVKEPKPVENREVQSSPSPAAVPVPEPVALKAEPVEAVRTEVPPHPVKSDFVLPVKKSEVESRTPWVGDVAQSNTKEAETISNQSDHTVSSLAQSKTKLRTPSDLPLASSLETSSMSGDPLFTKEVDEGLQQLLSEWMLFKKSGLFGTGPKGREHPLFLKVAELQIPLLLAGRFEGATQEVKQSITDYMNGWRYEQGIIYVPGETFEHYLRRVIRHILDLQKKKIVR